MPAIVYLGTQVLLHLGRALTILLGLSALGGLQYPHYRLVNRGSIRVLAVGLGGLVEHNLGRGFRRGYAVVKPHRINPVFIEGPPAQIIQQHRAS